MSELTIRDGSLVLVRPLRPTDRRVLAAAVLALSDDTRYKRFASPKPRLTERDLDHLLDLDHHDREALVAYEPITGRGLAVVRYARTPDDAEAVEIAATVVDDWQGRGLGGALVDVLAEHARRHGFRRLRATVLADNRASLAMLRGRGFARSGGDGALLEYAREL
jgi:RimJ/RimL family protein N-acetyltransferase